MQGLVLDISVQFMNMVSKQQIEHVGRGKIIFVLYLKRLSLMSNFMDEFYSGTFEVIRLQIVLKDIFPRS